MLVQLLEIYHENHYTLISQVWYLQTIQTEISEERTKIMNFCKRSYQHILRYLYTEAIKRRGEILLRRHFKNKLKPFTAFSHLALFLRHFG